MDFSNLLYVDKHWTLFLDRDGVINKRIMNGYVTAVEEFEFNPLATDAFALFKTFFDRVLVVTNQQGVGKEIMTEGNLLDVHAYMHERIKLAGGKLDRVYFSTDLKSKENNTRKPNPAMAMQAKKDFPEIDFSKSIMVGDTDSDLMFGKNLGMKTAAIRTEEKLTVEADYHFNSLFEFATHIVREQ